MINVLVLILAVIPVIFIHSFMEGLFGFGILLFIGLQMYKYRVGILYWVWLATVSLLIDFASMHFVLSLGLSIVIVVFLYVLISNIVRSDLLVVKLMVYFLLIVSQVLIFFLLQSNFDFSSLGVWWLSNWSALMINSFIWALVYHLIDRGVAIFLIEKEDVGGRRLRYA